MKDNGSNKRKYLKFDEIELLSENLDEDYNETLKAELCFNRYSMNRILKEYAGLDNDYLIHAFFEHGFIFTDYVGGAFRNHEYLPSIVPSDFRVSVLKSKDDYKKAYSIGPYIHYANYLLDKEELNAEKERLGHSLLVFPSHSVDEELSFDYEKFINEIKLFSKDYDTVRVCMYYNDVLHRKHVPYAKEGFEIVTAGHFNDYNFLPRLKSIIETSSMTVSNDISTHIGYCLYLNKPHYLIQNDVKFSEGKDSSGAVQNSRKNSVEGYNNYDRIADAFSEYEERITPEQYDVVSYLWGFNQVRSPKELKDMFLEINQNFSYLKYYFSGLVRLKNIIMGKRV